MAEGGGQTHWIGNSRGASLPGRADIGDHRAHHLVAGGIHTSFGEWVTKLSDSAIRASLFAAHFMALTLVSAKALDAYFLVTVGLALLQTVAIHITLGPGGHITIGTARRNQKSKQRCDEKLSH